MMFPTQNAIIERDNETVRLVCPATFEESKLRAMIITATI